MRARVSESKVCEERKPSKSQMANMSVFRGICAHFGRREGEEIRENQKAENIGYKKSKNQDNPTQVCFAALAR